MTPQATISSQRRPATTPTDAPSVELTRTSTGAIRCRSAAVVELADGSATPVRADLRGGRHEYRICGRTAQGFRWWYGWLEVDPVQLELLPRTEILLRLSDGRTATATVQHTAPTVPGRVAIRGIGRPPFDVP